MIWGYPHLWKAPQNLHNLPPPVRSVCLFRANPEMLQDTLLKLHVNVVHALSKVVAGDPTIGERQREKHDKQTINKVKVGLIYIYI